MLSLVALRHRARSGGEKGAKKGETMSEQMKIAERWTLIHAWNGVGQMHKFEHGEYVEYGDYLRAEEQVRQLKDALGVAWHALQSYVYGNSSPDLAKEVAEVLLATLDNAEPKIKP
jgi:hypothetical protein